MWVSLVWEDPLVKEVVTCSRIPAWEIPWAEEPDELHSIELAKNRTRLMYTLSACLVSQLCPTLCDPLDCSPPGFSVHGISQTRTLEGVPCPPQGDLPTPGMEPMSPVSPALKADSLALAPPGKPKLNS